MAVLEGIVDSTNVGAIFRSAAALNMDAVLINPSCCDPLCRRAVRVSMGTVFQVPWGQLGETPADWPEKGMDILHSLGFKTAAMALSDRSVSIDDEQLAKEPKLAIVLGTEGDGLAAGTIASCDYTVKIPMSHGVDSLNVAAASAVGDADKIRAQLVDGVHGLKNAAELHVFFRGENLAGENDFPVALLKQVFYFQNGSHLSFLTRDTSYLLLT